MLFNAVCGAVTAEKGRITLGGRDMTAWPDHPFTAAPFLW